MKRVLLALFFILLLVSPLVLSDVASSLGSSLEQNAEKAQEVKDTIEKSQETQYWEEKWDYLGAEWKTILLKNKYVLVFDAFFTKVSIVFQILFGIPYSLSALTLGVFLLWLFVAFQLAKFLNGASILFYYLFGQIDLFSGKKSYLASIILCAIIAQVKFFSSIVTLLTKLVVSPEYVWTRLIVLVLIFIIFSAIAYANRKLAIQLKENGKKRKELETEKAKESVKQFAKGVEEFSKLGDKKR